MTNLRQRAYERFLEALHCKELTLGNSYTQAEMCRVLGVSTNPLQAALKVLESEGFVVIKARAGITIKQPDLVEFRECHQLRQILEMAAVGQCASVAETDTLLRLKADIIALRERSESGEAPIKLAKNNEKIEIALHQGIIGALDNRTTRRIHQTNMEKVKLMRRDTSPMSNSHLNATASEHLEIVEAALERDVRSSQAALQRHLTAALERAIMTNLFTV